MTGKLKFYNRVKGWGFVIAEDGQEYFVHHTGILTGEKVLRMESALQGAKVEFDLGQNERGSVAVNVKITPDPAAK